MPYVNFKDFKKDYSLNPDDLDVHSHSIHRGTLSHTSSQVWYSKACYNQFDGFSELIGQNFFRLILSSPQPHGLLAIDFTRRQLYLLSQEVAGFKRFPNNSSDELKQSFKNLPQILLLSHFMEEIDLKNGNIGIDHNNVAVKIDGDLYFSSLKTKIHPKDFDISAQTISDLTLANHFYTYNWLDIVKAEKRFSSSTIIDINISNNANFQADVSQAILRICLLPKSFLVEFLKNHLQPLGNFFDTSLLRHFYHIFSSFFLCRQQILIKAAFNHEPFKLYLFSPHAEQDLSFLSQQLSNPNLFVPNGLPPMIHNYATSIKKLEEKIFEFRIHFFPLIELAQTNIRLLLKALKNSAHWPSLFELIKQYLKQSSSFEVLSHKTQTVIAIMDSLHHLQRIKELKINHLDEQTDKFCQKHLDSITQSDFDFEKIASQKSFLLNHFFQTRAAYQNIFTPIKSGLKSWGWWRIQSDKDKALEFEQQILALPFEERARKLLSPNFLTSTEEQLFKNMLFKPKLKNFLTQQQVAQPSSNGLWV